jgi:hypothetical protein
MMKNNYMNPKINKSFILGRGFNLKTNSIKNRISCSTSKKNKSKKKDLPIEHQKFLKSLINKTNYGKGFKIVKISIP